MKSELAKDNKAWPFQEGSSLLKRVNNKTPDKGHVLFETGYGPSGLPHIGTFGEVARTTMVRRAFEELCDIPTRLVAFSDDMDGMRKVPDNVPNQDMLAQFLEMPLSKVPDPFGTHDSFGAHNNARLQAFLDQFGFDYEFVSSTDCYQSGQFDEALLAVLRAYDEVMGVILPTLGAERRETYSPFLPVCPETGKVLQIPIIEKNLDVGTVVYENQAGKKVEVPITGGHCKLQWKADWAMRWFALGVDYEMSGKDLIESVKLSSKICRILGASPPESFTYELFLDHEGKKISKSVGNGITIDEWLRYASPESLSLYMFQQPRRAKRLYFDVIPRAVDDYLRFLEGFYCQEEAERLANPAWHIHGGQPPKEGVPVTFALLMNLASACNSEDPEVLWGFISRYAPGADRDGHPMLDALVGYAINYYRDFVKPHKQYRDPTDKERAAMEDLLTVLEGMEPGLSGSDIQNQVYEIGKVHEFENLRGWFKALYEVLFGQSQGPRFGSFAALYGVDETAALVRRALAGDDLTAE